MGQEETYPIAVKRDGTENEALTDLDLRLLSMLDGNTSLSALQHSTGIAPQQLRSILERLRVAGAIRFNSVPLGPVSSPTSGTRLKSSASDAPPQPTSVRLPIGGSPRVRAAEINPDDLEPTIGIELKTQKAILLLHARLSLEDHYALLGVARTAEKKEIKSAYFDLMNQFHTDKFYGKKLGGFEKRLQQIVEVLTKANDVLGRKKTRAEYDDYLASRETTRGARESMVPAMPSSAPPPASGATPSSGRAAVAPIDVIPNIPRAPKAPQIDEAIHRPGSSVPPSSESLADTMRPPTPAPDSDRRSRPPQSGAQPPSSGSPQSRSSVPPRNDAARRLLARKMGRRLPQASTPRTPTPSPAPKADPAERRKAVEADLRARYDARRGVNPEKAGRYLEMSQEAQNGGDWAAAMSALKMASACAPDDGSIKAKLQETQELADRALAPKFLEQAKYEEKDGRPERAARSYERAARGKKSAELFDKAAACLLKAPVPKEEDRRKVVELARQAVTLDNKNAAYRITLARAYDVAGMRTSAQGEARRALELEPKNDEAKQLHKELK